MRWRSESTLLGLIEPYKEHIAAFTKRAAENTSTEIDEELLSATVELQDLQNELEFVRTQASGSDESESFVGAPLRPLPNSNSAGVAVPKPSGN